MPNDDGVFASLINCGDTLKAARVVDRIPYYRFVELEMSADDGETQPAIFPADYALPRVVKGLAVDGWPPENLVAARGGRPLLDRWEDAAPDAVAPALARFTISDLDVFLADPRVAVGDERLRVLLRRANLDALLTTGRMLARLEDGKRVLVQAAPGVVGRGISENGAHKGIAGIAIPNVALEPEEPLPPPGLPPLPQLRFSVHLAYAQEWELVGYARGDLLNTISLAPQEETTIEVFTWDRRRATTEATEESAWETGLEASTEGRLSRDISTEVTRNEAWRLTSAGIQVSAPGDIAVGANLGGNFGTEVTRVGRDTVSLVSEATTKASTKARGLRQTKVSETHEWGSEGRTTRKLKNQNMGRGVSYDVYEVLAKYNVRTRIVPERARLALLVRNPLTTTIKVFDHPTVLAFEGALRRALLDETHRPGFDAVRWLTAREHYQALRKAREADEGPTAGPGGTPGPSGPVLAAGDAVAESLGRLLTANKFAVKEAYDAGKRGDQLDDAEIEFRQWMMRKFGFDKFQGGFWQACRRFREEWIRESNPVRTPERVEQLVRETSWAWAEAAGNVALAALLWPVFLVRVADIILTLATELGLDQAATHVWNGHVGFDDAGLGARIDGARAAAEAYRRTVDDQAPAPAPGGSTTTNPQPPPPPQPFPDEQAAVHAVSERALLTHLERNRGHYLEAVWSSFQAGDRALLLRTAYDQLEENVEPEVLGFHEDNIALPFRVDRYPELKARMDELLSRLRGLPEEAREVVVPTAGLHVQTRLGECDALEPFLAGHREQDLAEKKLAVKRAELENQRLQARLSAKPPLLEDPDHDGEHVAVRLVHSDGRSQ